VSSIFNNINTEFIHQYKDVKANFHNYSKDTSCDLNIFNQFNTDERMHSKILYNLLDYNGTHGQDDIFLKVFLETLGYEYNNKFDWIVSSESLSIDLWIRSKDFTKSIIIENKSNYAGDQGNQLYRYWYTGMYLKQLNVTGDRCKNTIIYLTPNENKRPDDQTCSKPDNLKSKYILPDRIPFEIVIWTYSNQVVGLLKNCIDLLPKCNYSILDYLKQYTEYWEV
jgi:hypothetical protein